MADSATSGVEETKTADDDLSETKTAEPTVDDAPPPTSLKSPSLVRQYSVDSVRSTTVPVAPCLGGGLGYQSVTRVPAVVCLPPTIATAMLPHRLCPCRARVTSVHAVAL